MGICFCKDDEYDYRCDSCNSTLGRDHNIVIYNDKIFCSNECSKTKLIY